MKVIFQSITRPCKEIYFSSYDWLWHAEKKTNEDVTTTGWRNKLIPLNLCIIKYLNNVFRKIQSFTLIKKMVGKRRENYEKFTLKNIHLKRDFNHAHEIENFSLLWNMQCAATEGWKRNPFFPFIHSRERKGERERSRERRHKNFGSININSPFPSIRRPPAII